MSEFMLILPGGAPSAENAPLAVAASRNPGEIARHLEAALAALDGIGETLAAAYLAMALDVLQVSFNPGEDSSGTD